jgi:4-amino-4-deoxy-L-arabinose transferase-like glycosyltransferase
MTNVNKVAEPTGSALPSLTFNHLLILLAALTIVRLIGLHFSSVDLYVDEAQYWSWSREFAFGYYSKPPLLAWIIAVSEAVCGSGEACVRAASPVIYFGTCLLVYWLARELYDQRTGLWSSLLFALATGVSFSTRIISTDVPLLFFWTLALFAYLKLMRAPDWRWTVVFGLALGFGMLAKYAMVYFGLCALVAAMIDRDARAMLLRPHVWVACLIALALVSPNIWWNITNSFATIKHTGENITGTGFRFRPMAPFGFLASQIILPGPIVFVAFLVLLWRATRSRLPAQDRLMIAFAAPPIALIALLGFVRTPNANWAAPAIVALVIVVVATWLRAGEWRWVKWTLGIGLAAQVLLIVADANAYRVSLPFGRQPDVYARTLGWHEFGDKVGQLAQQAQARSVAAEPRAELAALIYYLRDKPLRVFSWMESATPGDHFDLTRPLTDKAPEPIIYISQCAATGRLEQFYGEVTALGPFTTTAGQKTTRQYYAFKLAKPKGTIAPLGPCS